VGGRNETGGAIPAATGGKGIKGFVAAQAEDIPAIQTQREVAGVRTISTLVDRRAELGLGNIWYMLAIISPSLICVGADRLLFPDYMYQAHGKNAA
jgi:hypothetical protein